MSDEPDTKHIEGVCEEISEKNGWTNFAINVGSQYPVRLSTKLPALIEKGRAAGAARAVWTYKESQGGENPNKPGTHYTNRYLSDVEVGERLAVSSEANVAQPSPRTATRDDTRDSIERQVIVKEMVQHYPAIDKLSVDDWWALVYRLEVFLANGAPIRPSGETADDIPF